ncbi:hypothetical protein [Halomontanus rarus]|uniref:hypothetical protein n=1 Tax=Halomontanus rarus TaxID=3034020 RepID=UPI0023E82D1B|nr:hypothetical protein [Halovivax sp. TS33]
MPTRNPVLDRPVSTARGAPESGTVRETGSIGSDTTVAVASRTPRAVEYDAS